MLRKTSFRRFGATHRRNKICELVAVFLVIFISSRSCVCNQYDPRPFPETGPFFEGWYLRITDFTNHDSIGFLFGQVLPKPEKELGFPHVIATVLYRVKKDGYFLERRDALFNDTGVSVTVNGRTVTNYPDNASPANFRWHAISDQSEALLNQNVTTIFEFKQGDFMLRGKLVDPVQWGPNGEGPEGWGMELPLPLQWFVYSLFSRVEYYELKIGDEIRKSGRSAAAHMEKNWGRSFPGGWLWAQGAQESGVVLAIAGGPAQIVYPLPAIEAFLIGYRNPELNIDLSFKPYNSIVSTNFDGCGGSTNFTVRALWYHVEIAIDSDIGTYSECLLAPSENGFRPMCIETYDAVAEIVVWERDIFSMYSHIIDNKTIRSFALEFGGQYVCKESCHP